MSLGLLPPSKFQRRVLRSMKWEDMFGQSLDILSLPLRNLRNGACPGRPVCNCQHFPCAIAIVWIVPVEDKVVNQHGRACFG